MKPIAIHINYGFAPRWIEYCRKEKVPYEIVNCYDSDIISQLANYSVLFWHWNYDNYRDKLFAEKLIHALDYMDIIIFPDIRTCWHYNDKIAQKYLFESLKLNIPKTYVFYDKKLAIEWSESIEYPKVFKLRCGAGSRNVKLVNSNKEASKLIKKAFNYGFEYQNKIELIIDRYKQFIRNMEYNSFNKLVKSVFRFMVPRYDDNFIHKEKGYVLFQDYYFNSFDIRLVVINDKCFGIIRKNRPNDFRASGSGLFEYDPKLFDKRCIEIAFNITKKVKSQLSVFDFIFDNNRNPLLLEISYGFASGKAYDNCPGHWNEKLEWIEGKNKLEYLIIENVLMNVIKKSN